MYVSARKWWLCFVHIWLITEHASAGQAAEDQNILMRLGFKETVAGLNESSLLSTLVHPSLVEEDPPEGAEGATDPQHVLCEVLFFIFNLYVKEEIPGRRP